MDDKEQIFIGEEESVRVGAGFWKRAFAKMEKDSLRGGMFVLIISALGCGILALHKYFNEIGIIPGIFIILLVCLIFIFVSDILIDCLTKATEEPRSFNHLVELSLGKTYRKIFDVIFFFYLFLVLVTIVLTISSTIYKNYGLYIMKWFGVDLEKGSNFDDYHAKFNFFACYVIGFVFFFIVKQKSVEKFRYVSFYSFIIFIYIILVIFVEFYSYLKQDWCDDNGVCEPKTYNYYEFGFESFFKNLGISIFSFNCLTNFFSVASAIKRPNVRRLRKTFRRSFAILCALLLAVGLVGYFSVGRQAVDIDKLDLIIYRKPIGNSDYLMSIGRMFLILLLFVNAGINAFPLKIMIAHGLDWELKGIRNIGLSLTMTFIPVIIASLFVKISD